MRQFIMSIICLLVAGYLGAQEILPKDSIKLDQSISQDSLGVEQIASLAKKNKKSSKEFKGPMSMFAGKPGRAALYSLVLPGAGQAFNKKYWKIPFVWALEGTAIGILVYNIRGYKIWNEALNDYHAIPRIENPYHADRSANEILNIRNQRRKFKDYSIISVALLHLIQVADAFVNRHLIEFDVSDDLSIDLGSSQAFPSIGFIATF